VNYEFRKKVEVWFVQVGFAEVWLGLNRFGGFWLYPFICGKICLSAVSFVLICVW
jgi:hypothetical protein